MSDAVTVLSLDDRQEWEAAQEKGLPSQTWAYAAALSESGLRPMLAIVTCEGSRLLLPFVERSWRGSKDVATLPGLSGASIHPASAAPLALWRAYATDRGWVAGYLQLSPFTDAFPNLPPQTELVERTTILTVNPSRWDLTRTPSLIIRRKVGAARRANASPVLGGPFVAESLLRLHPLTARRQGGDLTFSDGTLMRWALDPSNLIIGLLIEGEIQAVHLIHVWKDEAELHLVGDTEIGREMSAWLHVLAIEQLKMRGVQRYNLGGAARDSGLFRFKTWLGGIPHPMFALQQVYDVPTYEAFCAGTGASGSGPWFPAYRGSV